MCEFSKTTIMQARCGSLIVVGYIYMVMKLRCSSTSCLVNTIIFILTSEVSPDFECGSNSARRLATLPVKELDLKQVYTCTYN